MKRFDGEMRIPYRGRLGFCHDLAQDPELMFDPKFDEYKALCRSGLLQSEQYRKGICARIFWREQLPNRNEQLPNEDGTSNVE